MSDRSNLPQIAAYFERAYPKKV